MFFKKKTTPIFSSFHGKSVTTKGSSDKSSECDYLDQFMSRNQIESPRKGIFVNRDLVHQLAKYVQVLGQGDASIGAYVEEIILDHLRRNKSVIDSLFNTSPMHRL